MEKVCCLLSARGSRRQNPQPNTSGEGGDLARLGTAQQIISLAKADGLSARRQEGFYTVKLRCERLTDCPDNASNPSMGITRSQKPRGCREETARAQHRPRCSASCQICPMCLPRALYAARHSHPTAPSHHGTAPYPPPQLGPAPTRSFIIICAAAQMCTVFSVYGEKSLPCKPHNRSRRQALPGCQEVLISSNPLCDT